MGRCLFEKKNFMRNIKSGTKNRIWLKKISFIVLHHFLITLRSWVIHLKIVSLNNPITKKNNNNKKLPTQTSKYFKKFKIKHNLKFNKFSYANLYNNYLKQKTHRKVWTEIKLINYSKRKARFSHFPDKIYDFIVVVFSSLILALLFWCVFFFLIKFKEPIKHTKEDIFIPFKIQDKLKRNIFFLRRKKKHFVFDNNRLFGRIFLYLNQMPTK